MSTETTVLGVLSVVLTAVGTAGMVLMRTLLSDVLATNRALRESLSTIGIRLAYVERALDLQGDMVEQIHADNCEPRRTSNFGDDRKTLREVRDKQLAELHARHEARKEETLT